MFIDPLDPVKPAYVKEIADTRVGKVVNDIVDFLIRYHADILSDVQINVENNRITEKVIREKIYRDHAYVNIDINELVKKVLDRLFGYHILQKYIDNREVSDIRVTAYDNIWIRKKGKWFKTGDKFSDEDEYFNFVRYCVLKNKGRITEEKPSVLVSDRINKLRIHARIHPVNISPPSLVIRIHRPEVFSSLEELYSGESFMMNLEMYDFLTKVINAGCNIIIAGPSASGKTTLLRALINKIPDHLAITTNEESAELHSSHPNIIQSQILSDREENKNIDLEKLTRESLLMTNDVIVVGEIKSSETLALFDAMSTGHICYTTVHSDKAETTLDRIIILMKKNPLAQQYSDQYLRELLADSIDLIIYVKRFKVVEISEVIIEESSKQVKYNPLFQFSIKEFVDGEMKGIFIKAGHPMQKVKDKLLKHSKEFERLYVCECHE